MAILVSSEDVGTNGYRKFAPPVWGGGAIASLGEKFIKVFLGRKKEDIRVYDAETKEFVKKEGPAVEITLTEMDKQDFQALKAAVNTMSGRVHIYKIKNRERTKGAKKDKVVAGALWLPA
jgi:hypothetical protein